MIATIYVHGMAIGIEIPISDCVPDGARARYPRAGDEIVITLWDADHAPDGLYARGELASERLEGRGRT
jgi:hypothetical protein